MSLPIIGKKIFCHTPRYLKKVCEYTVKRDHSNKKYCLPNKKLHLNDKKLPSLESNSNENENLQNAMSCLAAHCHKLGLNAKINEVHVLEDTAANTSKVRHMSCFCQLTTRARMFKTNDVVS